MSTKKYDIAFLGGLFPKETEAEVIKNSIGLIDNAANNLQWSLIKGLDENLSHPLTIINSLYIGSYPNKYRQLFIRKYIFKHTSNATDINVGFVNLTVIKHLSRLLSVRPFLRQWAENKTSKQKVLIAYALTSIFVESLSYIKKKYPSIMTIVIVPDLPQFMDTTSNNNVLYNLLKRLSIKHIKHKIRNIDGFVLLTKYMADTLDIVDKKTTIVEGISKEITTEAQNINPKTDTNNIVYTGTLNERYGILNLLEAFKQIEGSHYRLIICGCGDSERIVSESAKVDNRIIFKGQLKRDEIITILNGATILVNPRQNNEEFTKYSFPSKIMEYLSSGKPVIAYKLDGIPDEYDNYINYVPDNSVESLAKMMKKICEQPQSEQESFGTAARNWVLKEKNGIIQTRKIIDMIESMRYS